MKGKKNQFLRELLDDLGDMVEAWGRALRALLLRFLVFWVFLAIGISWAAATLDPYIPRIR
jgi:hypothetical protein